MAKLADAADLKSAGPKGLWGFDSPSRHQYAALATGAGDTPASAIRQPYEGSIGVRNGRRNIPRVSFLPQVLGLKAA
jgi:hypothetical protein